jgi:hypothetical protein
MFMLALLITSWLPQNAPAPACTLLTPQEISSIVGITHAMPVYASAGSSTCMLQNGDKILTVMIVTRDTTDAAQGLWNSKKAVAAASDVQGWPVKAYSSTFEKAKEHDATVGVVKGKTFVEAKVTDATQPVSALSAKLLAVMKAVSGRM